MIPTTRAEFKEFCLRALGKTVLQINVSDEQIDDRISVALRRFMDFHFEGTEKVYYKYQVTQNNYSTSIYALTLVSGGTGYSNADPIVFSGGGSGSASNGSITTNSNGVITAVTLVDNGLGFGNAPTVTIPSSGGTGAVVTAELGGFIPLPENIIGAVNLFEVGSQAGASNLFSLRYQIVLNDLYMFNNLNIVPYAIAMHNVAQIHEVLVGKQPIRYNRYINRLYVDMDWTMVNVGDFIIAECYRVVDPETYTACWGDPWLQKYATVLIKEQWGTNLKKFGNMPMVGGMYFNGQQIYDEARQEKFELEEELNNVWISLPMDFIG